MTKRQPSVLAAWGVQERNYEETDCCIAFRGSNGSDRDANGSDHSMSQTKKSAGGNPALTHFNLAVI